MLLLRNPFGAPVGLDIHEATRPAQRCCPSTTLNGNAPLRERVVLHQRCKQRCSARSRFVISCRRHKAHTALSSVFCSAARQALTPRQSRQSSAKHSHLQYVFWASCQPASSHSKHFGFSLGGGKWSGADSQQCTAIRARQEDDDDDDDEDEDAEINEGDDPSLHLACMHYTCSYLFSNELHRVAHAGPVGRALPFVGIQIQGIHWSLQEMTCALSVRHQQPATYRCQCC